MVCVKFVSFTKTEVLRVVLTEVLVFPDLCSNEVNCFITKTEILLNLLLRGGEMSKRFAL